MSFAATLLSDTLLSAGRYQILVICSRQGTWWLLNDHQWPHMIKAVQLLRSEKWKSALSTLWTMRRLALQTGRVGAHYATDDPKISRTLSAPCSSDVKRRKRRRLVHNVTEFTIISSNYFVDSLYSPTWCWQRRHMKGNTHKTSLYMSDASILSKEKQHNIKQTERCAATVCSVCIYISICVHDIIQTEAAHAAG